MAGTKKFSIINNIFLRELKKKNLKMGLDFKNKMRRFKRIKKSVNNNFRVDERTRQNHFLKKKFFLVIFFFLFK